MTADFIGRDGEGRPRERHFYLFFMAVNPSFQGKGLGSAILEATLKHIDETGMPAYLENSNVRNRPSMSTLALWPKRTFPPRRVAA